MHGRERRIHNAKLSRVRPEVSRKRTTSPVPGTTCCGRSRIGAARVQAGRDRSCALSPIHLTESNIAGAGACRLAKAFQCQVNVMLQDVVVFCRVVWDPALSRGRKMPSQNWVRPPSRQFNSLSAPDDAIVMEPAREMVLPLDTAGRRRAGPRGWRPRGQCCGSLRSFTNHPLPWVGAGQPLRKLSGPPGRGFAWRRLGADRPGTRGQGSRK